MLPILMMPSQNAKSDDDTNAFAIAVADNDADTNDANDTDDGDAADNDANDADAIADDAAVAR